MKTPEKYKDISFDLRGTCVSIRVKPYPISDVIPQLQKAADTIDELFTQCTEFATSVVELGNAYQKDMDVQIKMNNALVDKLEAAENALRAIASYVTVGGYNSIEVDPKVYQEKIIWGIDALANPTMLLPAKWSDWIDWQSIPDTAYVDPIDMEYVKKDSFIEVQLRNGLILSGKPYGFDWESLESDEDIISFRVLETV